MAFRKMDQFSIFSITKSYKIDKKLLDKRYLELQSKYHPDMASTEQEMEDFLKMSTLVNDSYKILKNDHTRAILIIKAAGVDPADAEMSHAFLDSIWEKNELLDNSKESSDVDLFISSIEADSLYINDTLQSALDEGNYKIASAKALELKYLENLLNKAKSKRNNAIDRNI